MQIGSRVRGLFKRSTPAVQTKGLQIVNDGFIPRDVVTLSDLSAGRGSAPASEGLDANVVMAPVAWIMRTFPEAVTKVRDITDEESPEWIKGHPVQKLVRRPNPAYNGDALWQGTVMSFALNGNAYWQKIRNRFGQVIQLWYRPHWLVKPHSPPDGSQFIDYYEYDTGRGIQRLNVRDVVHFKFGLDPRDPRYGFGPLRGLLQDVLTDQQAAQFSFRILKNMGIPGVVISPSVSPTGEAFEPGRAEVEALKEYVDNALSGERVGKTLVFGQPTQATQFGFDPSKLTLGELRDQAEERVCAMLGIPSAVVGFGSGMEQTKIGAVMKELVKLAWRQCLFPMQRSMSGQLDEQLLADFVPDYEDRQQVGFDASSALSLQEDDSERTVRVNGMVEAGYLRVDHAQAMTGVEVDKTQQGYLRPMTVMFVPSEVVPTAVEPMAPPGADTEDGTDPGATKGLEAVLARMGNGNGNGHHTEGASDV